MMLDTRTALPRHDLVNASAFAMCPAAFWVQQPPTPSLWHSIYTYAFEQAQRVAERDQLHRLLIASLN